MTAEPERVFFLHVMKTGGATLLAHILRNFERPAVYPDRAQDDDIYSANYMIDYLLSIPPERRKMIRVYSGHFPYVAAELLRERLTTITILRNPVDRTLSYLRHCQRYHEKHRGLELEEIYEDPFYFSSFIHNHQTKLFSFTTEDRPGSYMDNLDIDDDRLLLAQKNLERVDVLGVRERFPELLEALADRFSWRFDQIPSRRVNPGDGVPASFRRRIERDNEADVQFYQHALELCERRRRSEILS